MLHLNKPVSGPQHESWIVPKDASKSVDFSGLESDNTIIFK